MGKSSFPLSGVKRGCSRSRGAEWWLNERDKEFIVKIIERLNDRDKQNIEKAKPIDQNPWGNNPNPWENTAILL